MLRRFKSSVTFLMKLLAFLLCAACFFGLFGLEYFFLLRPSRTLGVTAVAFVVVYVLMTKVYGGFDIGKRKSKPIVFSMALTLLLTDLVTHFLLCIMNTTVIHGGRFVYECPLLLLAVYMLQVALVIIMAYGGNDLYFKVNKPQRCLMVARRGECIEDLIKKVGRYKKQYNIQQVAWLDQPDLLTCVDHADAVFLYELSVRERTDLVEYCYQTRKDLYYSLEMSDVVAMAGERVMFDDKTMMYCPVRELRFEERIVKRLGGYPGVRGGPGADLPHPAGNGPGHPPGGRRPGVLPPEARHLRRPGVRGVQIPLHAGPGRQHPRLRQEG